MIHPIATDAFVKSTEAALCAVKEPGTRLDSVWLESGPLHLTYRYYEAEVIPQILRIIRKAERDGYDAALISCFFDPGLYAAREIVQKLSVAAPCEACCHIASTLGHKFSVLANDGKCVSQIEETIRGYGFADRLASIRSLGLGVHDLHKDEADTAERMETQARAALREDGAEVIVLGCTVQIGFCEELQRKLNIPVIDAEIAALHYAEFLVGLRDRCGWVPSRRGRFAPPPREELGQFGLL